MTTLDTAHKTKSRIICVVSCATCPYLLIGDTTSNCLIRGYAVISDEIIQSDTISK